VKKDIIISIVCMFAVLIIGLAGCKSKDINLSVNAQTQEEKPAAAVSSQKVSASCRECLAGISVPPKDFQVVDDKSYTEVVIIDSAEWDTDKLPKKVVGLQGKGYICSPVPVEFGPVSKSTGQPSIKVVRWECALRYNDYRHLGSLEQDKMNSLVKDGYSCKKVPCIDERGLEDYVWFCAK